MKKPKIITLDIETAPMQSHHWGLWDQNIGLDMIGTDWSILSVAWKELGKSAVSYLDTQGDPRNDMALIATLWEVLNDADIVVAHNGKRFDIKKLNARFVKHGHGPYSPVRVIDTLSAAKAHFGFSSNKLEFLSEHLTDTPKSKHKKFPGFELWKECLADNPKAWAEMKKYNIRDVKATEKVYQRLRPWIANHPNMGAYSETDAHECPKCGSTNTQKRGVAVLQQGRYHRYQCNDCGGWSRGKQMVFSLTKRRSLLVPQ